MPRSSTTGPSVHVATTHADAAALLRRPFAPGATGFRAMMKVPLNGDPFGGAQVAAYIGAQSVLQRLNVVVPGRWRMEFKPTDPPPGSKRLYMACRLTITLPISEGGADVEATYEDVGEMDAGSRAGLKALYSDARKRAAVAAGIGAYLYTALEPVALPIGPGERQVQVSRRSGSADTLALSAATEQWLRHGYQQRMSTEAVRRDRGEILSHGEPDHGMGQGEAAEQEAERSDAQAFWDGELAPDQAEPAEAEPAKTTEEAPGDRPRDNGLVVVDFRGLGPGSAAPRPGAGATSTARSRRHPGRCSSAAASTTPSRPTTAGSSSTAIAWRSTRCSTSTASCGTPSSRPSGTSRASTGRRTSERASFELGRHAVELAMTELVPHLGDPVDVQRRLEFTIAPELEWTVLCYLDLETLKETLSGEPSPTVVDLKVKGSLLTQEQADSHPQAGIYLAGRWLENYRADELLFAQIAKPGKRRKRMSASLVSTRRNTGQLRGALARIALAASQITACNERYGPDQPWGFADPTSWKCSQRYCHAWASCPGGAGL